MRIISTALLLGFLLIAGCAGSGPQAAGTGSTPRPLPSNFSVPPAGVEYTAHYRINEGGGEIEKTVWRSGTNARVEIGSGASAFDLYFLSDRAYSCSAGKCFDVTSAVPGTEAAQLFSEPDFSSARPAEKVDIGGTTGKCYLFPYAPFESRKMCFTQDMIPAYDEYNATRGQVRVEYLTELIYGTSPQDFALPSQPQSLPQQAS